MPADGSRQRPGLEPHRTSSTTNRAQKSNNDTLDSSTATPPTQQKTKGAKSHHVVGRAGMHGRNHSYGKLHRMKSQVETQGLKKNAVTPSTSPRTEAAGLEVSDDKLSRHTSATDLKKNTSHASLKRNRSSADVKRPRSSGQLKRSSSSSKVVHNKSSQRTTVHFDIGNDGNDDGDGWTEASGSASPNLSRTGSIAGRSSGRSSAREPASATQSEAQSPTLSPTKIEAARDWSSSKQNTIPDPSQITSRLLLRTASHNAAPKMSEVSATGTPGQTPSDTYRRAQHNTPGSGREPVVSRFVGDTQGTPGDQSPLLGPPSGEQGDLDAARKTKSMGNLTKPEPAAVDSEEDHALGPRSRKGSTHSYRPAQQSRTQQKLWLQRASSTIEPQQLAPSATLSINGFPALAVPSSPLVGCGYDGKDPRVKMQLDKTGMEYLVVRRYQDPVGRALRRLPKLPGNERMKRIPPTRGKLARADTGSNRYGLSQSMSNKARDQSTSSAYEASVNGSVESGHDASEDGVSALLRSIWDKSLELSASVE